MKLIVYVLFALAMAGCAGDQAFVQGEKLLEQGRVEEGLAQLRAASLASPNNEEYRIRYRSALEIYVNQLLIEADKARLLGRYEEAAAVYSHVLDLDAENSRAEFGLDAVAAEEIQRRDVLDAQVLFDAGKRAGFRRGDIFVSFDGRTTHMTETNLMAYVLQSKSPTARIPVTVLRGGKRIKLTLPLQR